MSQLLYAGGHRVVRNALIVRLLSADLQLGGVVLV